MAATVFKGGSARANHCMAVGFSLPGDQQKLISSRNLGETDTICYDVAIAGGGLGGLCAAIILAKSGRKVILFEKDQYPFHRVCGEYISMESYAFVTDLGVDLKLLEASSISRLQITGMKGESLEQKLPLGGFGISRFRLDQQLAVLAQDNGALLKENTRVNDIHFSDGTFRIETSAGEFFARVVCGSFGKRSNIDIKWKRPFALAAKNKLNNYIGIKYHVRLPNFPEDQIALHIFPNGYCGIVKIEGDDYNLCYLTTADNLKRCAGSISKMEKRILSRNPALSNILQELESQLNSPVTISQISFSRKTQVEEHVLMIGDAAGMITPLCGNGMSMAMHASKLATIEIEQFLSGSCSRLEMETNYSRKWKQHFSARLKTGRTIQRLFGHPLLTRLLIQLSTIFPKIGARLIRLTHGKPF